MAAPVRFVRLSLSSSSSPSAIHSQNYAVPLRRFCAASSQLNHDDAAAIETNSYKRRSSRISPYGRVRRKIEAKRRDEDAYFSLQPKDGSHDPSDTSSQTSPKTTRRTGGDAQSTATDHTETKPDGNTIGKFLLGTPMENPIRRQYMESQLQWKYPRTIQGWRTAFRRAWATYLWTWEGWLLPEKKRDEHGNVIEEPDKKDGHDEDDDTSTKETIQDKVEEAANQISQNLQKNVSTIQREAPKLLSTAQKLTGISTKEELKEWVSEQLKLGTECLSMFMKGYREGRDEEVDKMLHEYFKELDEEKHNEVAMKEESGSSEEEPSEESSTAGSGGKIVEKRPWGRTERRRLKAMGRQFPMVDAINS